MQVVIELPGIKAVSRNETTGHYFHYKDRLNEAEAWAWAYGKSKEHHFTGQVDVLIEAYYKVGGHSQIADAPNIDDKIFTDILVRWKRRKKGKPIERNVWWIEDDKPKYLRFVKKRSIPSTFYRVVITIAEVPYDETPEGYALKLSSLGESILKSQRENPCQSEDEE